MQTQLMIKRFFDMFFAVLSLLLLSPLILLLVILIPLSSKGPVFFKQQRLGLYGKEFTIYKFRTMILNAEQLGAGLSVHSEQDTRITTLGRFLRKTSLDELPQLFNVLNGSMSLVGPRPPVIYHPYNGYDQYPTWAMARFNMKPGITGLAQVKVRNAVSWDERIKVDLLYINQYSLRLDMWIIAKTILRLIHPQALYLKGSE